MGYRSYINLKVGIIGSCEQAEFFAKAYSLAGHEVYLSHKAGSASISEKLLAYGHIYDCTIEEVGMYSDFIFIVTPPADVREIAYWLGDVRTKVIIDFSSNVLERFPGTMKEMFNTASAISAITGSANIVKAFNGVGCAAGLHKIAGEHGIELIIAGDSKKSKELTKIIAREIGISQIQDCGGSSNFQYIDELAVKCQYMSRSLKNIALQRDAVV